MARKRRRRLGPAVYLLVFLVATAVTGLCYFELAPPEKTCLSCHEIESSYTRWAESAHREVTCKSCHGGTLSAGFHGVAQSLNRVVGHFTEEDHDDIGLREAQMISMMERCRACHEREYDEWAASGHAATYGRIFLDEEHNHRELLREECLECHGMFFPGKIADLVTPINREGPWTLRRPDLADRPAIPCHACHRVHIAGEPSKNDPKKRARRRRNPPLALYVRGDEVSVPAGDMAPLALSSDGEPVRVSADVRQRVCVQCHAPGVAGQAGTGDDRTPTGVHEGLGCLTCHGAHSGKAGEACAKCHPRMSNCGIDVETMDTTHRSPESPNDIHTVTCVDCHSRGVPERRREP